MQKIFKLLLPIISVLTACELTVDVDLPEFKPSLVVNSVINPEDTAVFVNLSQNRNILDNFYDFTPVTNATIKFYENQELIGSLSSANDPGNYYLEFSPQRGKEYSISIEKTGFETVAASTKIPEDTTLISIIKSSKKTDEYGNQNTRITYMIKDPKGSDYYETKLYRLSSYESWYYDPELDSTIHIQYGPEWQMVFYYNVGADVNEFSDAMYHNQFSDELFDGQNWEATIEFTDYSNQDQSGSDTAQYKLVVKRLSVDYYKYSTSASLQSDLGNSPFAQPIQVSSNIENGLGVFGSYNSSNLRFQLIKGVLQE